MGTWIIADFPLCFLFILWFSFLFHLIKSWFQSFNLLLTQCCSRPHCVHLLGARSSHWQPPLTQQAHFCGPLLKSEEIRLLLFLLVSWWFQRHAHPSELFVHKSTWPENTQKKWETILETIISSIIVIALWCLLQS